MFILKLEKATLIPSATEPNKSYLEVGDIRYIFEDGVYVGWYRPELGRVV
jgi:hypothetical protein